MAWRGTCAGMCGSWAAMVRGAGASWDGDRPYSTVHLTSIVPMLVTGCLPCRVTCHACPSLHSPAPTPPRAVQVRGSAAEGRGRAQRRRRPRQAAQRGHAAAQVLQPPLPVPGRGARPALHYRCVCVHECMRACEALGEGRLYARARRRGAPEPDEEGRPSPTKRGRLPQGAGQGAGGIRSLRPDDNVQCMCVRLDELGLRPPVVSSIRASRY